MLRSNYYERENTPLVVGAQNGHHRNSSVTSQILSGKQRRLDLIGPLEILAPLKHSLSTLFEPATNEDVINIQTRPLGRDLAYDDPYSFALLCIDEQQGSGFKVWDNVRRPRQGWFESSMSYWGRLSPSRITNSWNREFVFASLLQKPYGVVYLTWDMSNLQQIEETKRNLKAALELYGLTQPKFELNVNRQQLRFFQDDVRKIVNYMELDNLKRVQYAIEDILDFQRPNNRSGFYALRRCRFSQVPFAVWMLVLGAALVVFLLSFLMLYSSPKSTTHSSS